MSNAVLIVDDEKSVLQSLKRLLREDGYDLHLAEGGAAALEILSQTEIAVIVCDQRMPGMSGAQVLAEAYRLQPEAIRITLTGHTDILAAQASVNEGHVSHFLFKPWNDEHLRSVIRHGLGAYQLAQENCRLESLVRQQTEELEAWNKRLEGQVCEKTEELRTQNESLVRLHGRLDLSLRDTVRLVAGMLEIHSPNLGIHCRKVAELALALAQQFGLQGDSLRDVEFAAHLHDIGKLSKTVASVSSQGRNGRTAKTPAPMSHTEAGYALLSQVSGFENIALAVRHLHEQYDGAGIPSGLKHDEIPLASRIIAVANAYHSAISSLANPTSVSHQAGCQVLLRGKGTRFDPRFVNLLLRHFSAAGATAQSHTEVEISARKLQAGMVLSRPIHSVAGLLMLNEGTILTPELIESILRIGDVDPLTRSVFVRCKPDSDQVQIDHPSPQSTEHVPVDSVDPSAEPEPEIRNSREQPPTDSRPNPASNGRRNILVVDDSILLCNALKRELHSAGLDVVVTQNGWTALRLTEDTHFDAAIVDLMMPAMPGEELVVRLKQQSPAMPCIVLTGNATRERVAVLAQQTNVAAILVKPWEHNRLLTTITSAIAKAGV